MRSLYSPIWIAIPVLAGFFSIGPAIGATGSDEPNQAFASSYLHVEGAQLVTATGKELPLHGINLGGWLVIEDWMCGITDVKDAQQAGDTDKVHGRSVVDSLEDRFGRDQASTLLNAWQDHWITSRDLDVIRDGGFNLIRVPFSYRTLQHADGSWVLDASGQIDFSRMDWIVREAAQRGIYTIFDLHVWPQQTTSSALIGKPEGDSIRQSMARLWTAVAAHYRGNGAIAAFDLINEFPGSWGVQQVLYRAVQDGDPNRVQVIEGFTYPEFMKLHDAGQFGNSVFSEHIYGVGSLTTTELVSRLKELQGSSVPVYIGEFLATDFSEATQAMDLIGASWSSWTYKVVDMGDWGLFNYYGELKTDIQRDSFQTLNMKWSNALTAWQLPNATQDHFINDTRELIKSAVGGAPLP